MVGKLLVYYGEELYLVDRKVVELKKKLLAPGMEVFAFQLLEGENCLIDDIVNAIQTIPSFTPHRLVIIKNPFFLKKKKDENKELETEEEENSLLSPEQEKLLMDSLKNIPEGVTVVWQIHGSLDLRKRLGKFLKSVANEICEFPLFKSWEKDKVVNWLINEAKERGYILEFDAANLLGERGGMSLAILNNELDKLIIYAGDNKQITLSLVKEIISRGEALIFDLGDAFLSRDIPKMLDLIVQLNKEGTPFQVILGYLANQVRQVLKCKIFLQEKKVFPPNSFRIEKSGAVKKYSLSDLQDFFFALQKADLDTKTGVISPELALAMAVSELQKR